MAETLLNGDVAAGSGYRPMDKISEEDRALYESGELSYSELMERYDLGRRESIFSKIIRRVRLGHHAYLGDL